MHLADSFVTFDPRMNSVNLVVMNGGDHLWAGNMQISPTHAKPSQTNYFFFTTR